ncbi:MAG: glycosyltransferase family 8 protein [Candidatus Woesearchaeota archaeon]
MTPLCLCFDNNFTQHAATTIVSILENTKNKNNFFLYLTEMNVTKTNKLKLEKLLKKYNVNYKINKYDGCYKNLPQTEKLNESTYIRLQLPKKLKKYKKIIYIDSDIIFKSDIQPLISLKSKKIIIATPSSYSIEKERVRILGLKNKKYFNAGLMIINTQKWIKNHTTEKTIKFLENKNNEKKIKYADQDGLNYVLNEKWEKLGYEWNYRKSIIERAMLESGQKVKPSAIHFTEKIKPWFYMCTSEYQKEYLKYLKKSPWKHYKFPDKNIKNIFIKKKLKIIIIIQKTNFSNIIPAKIKKKLHEKIFYKYDVQKKR